MTNIETRAPSQNNALFFDVAALALAGAGNALLAARVNLAPIALGMIALALVLRIIQTRAQLLRIPLLLPALLFVVSAWIGVTVSFDPALSLQKFNLILGGVALYVVLAATRTNLAQRLVAWGMTLIGAGVGAYYLTQTDFVETPTKVAALDQIGMTIHRLAPQFGYHTPHPNLMAGILLLALPFACGIVYDAVRHKRVAEWLVAGALALFITFALGMTTSRGALLALVLLGGVSVLCYAAMQIAKRAGQSASIGFAAALNILLVGALVLVIVGGNRLSNVLGTVSSVPRPVLYQQVLQLIQDYSFTGAGLDTFSPNFSTYEMLIYVHLLPHAHDLYLQIWYEQGLVGLLAFVWFMFAYYVWCIRRRARMNWLAVASLATTTLMLLHGLVDVLFYFSRVISLMFIPLGLAICALDPFTPLPVAQKISRRARLGIAAGASAVLVLGALFLFAQRERVAAQWSANWGALAQAHIELPQIKYPHPTFPEVRRANNFDAAQKLFQDALQHDANNRVANARLGMLALDQLDFEQAVARLEKAYAADKTNRAVIKALGMAYAWSGKFEQARPLLKQIPEASVEMGYATDAWRKLGRADLAAYAQTMVQRLK